jgi:hypothetical protein
MYVHCIILSSFPHTLFLSLPISSVLSESSSFGTETWSLLYLVKNAFSAGRLAHISPIDVSAVLCLHVSICFWSYKVYYLP